MIGSVSPTAACMAQGPAQTQPFDDGDDDEKLNVRGTKKVYRTQGYRIESTAERAVREEPKL